MGTELQVGDSGLCTEMVNAVCSDLPIVITLLTGGNHFEECKTQS